jgi:hypothetical protein
LLGACIAFVGASSASDPFGDFAGDAGTGRLDTPRAAPLTVALAGAQAATGAPGARVVPVAAPPNAGQLSIKVSGNQFVDARGQPVQLRGVNVAGLESNAIFGWTPDNPWGGQTGTPTPDWNVIKSWGVNAVRIPLNEASWLGLTCVSVGGSGFVVTHGTKVENRPGTMVKADPGGNYKETVAASVAGATAAGLYVILDLHWTAPAQACPMVQNLMPDADHAIAFWTSVATTYKSYPSVLFELFNEPCLPPSEENWFKLLDGGTQNSYLTGGNPAQVSSKWEVAGMQQMLDAVRATGAANVVLTAGQLCAGDLASWLRYKPTDPAGQLAAVWHAYPAYQSVWGTDAYRLPNAGKRVYADILNILAEGYPVLITEFGDRNAPGTVGAPFVSGLLPWADSHGLGYLGWTWDTWQAPDHVLILNGAGDPTPGYGSYVKAHYLCRAGGNPNCP